MSLILNRKEIGKQLQDRRLSNSVMSSQKTLNTISEGQPTELEGYNGQEIVRYVKNKGLYHFIKRNGRWHSSPLTENT